MSSTYLQKLFSLEGQVAVVIGGTGVLGGALCEGIAQAGAHVVVAGRSEERGRQRVGAIERLGAKASFVPVDVTSHESIEQLLSSVAQQHGQVHALVNAAGVNSATPYLEITEEDFDRVIQTNLKSTHLACQIFGRHMMEAGGGSIVNIGSVTSFLPLSRVFIYSASKAAVLNLTQNVAREFAPHKIRVNCLCPGFFPAEQNRKILDEQRVADILGRTPMGRFGEPEELIGPMLLMLAPNAGSFLTGEAIYVDGGFTSMTI
jgi:NAD(P)-dependent dehydrogenase (short-subunit alcohol dehydrogenase family)